MTNERAQTELAELRAAREIAGPLTTCKQAIICGEHDDWAEVQAALAGIQWGRADAVAALTSKQATDALADAIAHSVAGNDLNADSHANAALGEMLGRMTRTPSPETPVSGDEQQSSDMVERVVQPLGGDDLVMRLMYELHSHVPEEQKPLSMSDLSDEQAARARKAVHAVVAEWEAAKHGLVDAQNAKTASFYELIARLHGRAAFLRDRGEIKSPELMEQAAAALEASHHAELVEALTRLLKTVRCLLLFTESDPLRDDCPVRGMAKAAAHADVVLAKIGGER
jgi:hypothetical protein